MFSNNWIHEFTMIIFKQVIKYSHFLSLKIKTYLNIALEGRLTIFYMVFNLQKCLNKEWNTEGFIDHAGHSKCSRVIYILSCVIHRSNLTETVIWALSLWTVQIARVLGVISRPPTENSCQSHNGGDHHMHSFTI